MFIVRADISYDFILIGLIVMQFDLELSFVKEFIDFFRKVIVHTIVRT